MSEEVEVSNGLTRLFEELALWKSEALVARARVVELERLLMKEREQARATEKTLRRENRGLKDNLRYYTQRKAKNEQIGI